jgi:putative FmdB family regulatory protein
MPIYEYTCRKCGATFEAMNTMARRDEMECEKCGSPDTERLASTFCCSVEESSGLGSVSSSGPACGAGG